MSAPLDKLLREARIDLVMSRIEKDSSIINEVISHLDNEIRSIKFNSIHILGLLGEKSEKSIPKLIILLDNDDWSICRETVRSLGKIGNSAINAIPKLSKLLSNNEVSIRKEAAMALGKIGNPTDESISNLIMACNDEDEEVRTEVAKTFGDLGPKAQEAIPALMKCLKDVNWTVRTASAQSINQIGRDSTTAIPSLIDALEDDDWRVRYRVINTLSEIGKDAIPSLQNKLASKNAIVRKGAIDALSEMKIDDPKIINSISFLLTDKAEAVRGRAADALRNIGKEAVPALIEALEKSNTKMKLIVISALGGIGRDAVLSIKNIINMLYHHDQKVEYSPSFISHLKSMIVTFLNDPFSKNASIRVESARALGRIGFNSEDAVHALEAALNDPKYIVRREAALSLGKLGLDSKVVVPTLINTLNDRNPDVRWRSSEALGLIGINSEQVMTGLNDLVHDKCDYVCESAINALDTLTEE